MKTSLARARKRRASQTRGGAAWSAASHGPVPPAKWQKWRARTNAWPRHLAGPGRWGRRQQPAHGFGRCI